MKKKQILAELNKILAIVNRNDNEELFQAVQWLAFCIAFNGKPSKQSKPKDIPEQKAPDEIKAMNKEVYPFKFTEDDKGTTLDLDYEVIYDELEKVRVNRQWLETQKSWGMKIEQINH
jgi:hypothetical protein